VLKVHKSENVIIAAGFAGLIDAVQTASWMSDLKLKFSYQQSIQSLK